MTAIEYMERQIFKHKLNLEHLHPNTPPDHVENIKNKISYYEEAVEALERMKNNASN